MPSLPEGSPRPSGSPQAQGTHALTHLYGGGGPPQGLQFFKAAHKRRSSHRVFLRSPLAMQMSQHFLPAAMVFARSLGFPWIASSSTPRIFESGA